MAVTIQDRQYVYLSSYNRQQWNSNGYILVITYLPVIGCQFDFQHAQTKTIFPLFSPCCLIQKLLVQPLEFRYYLVYELRYTYFLPTSGIVTAIYVRAELFLIWFLLISAIIDERNTHTHARTRAHTHTTLPIQPNFRGVRSDSIDQTFISKTI